MAEAAIQGGIKPRQISFKHSLQIGMAWIGQAEDQACALKLMLRE